MAWLRRNGLNIFAAFAVLYLLVPIIVVALFSFGDTPRGKLTFTLDDGFTLEYWKDAFKITELNDALVTSLKLAAETTVIATVIGTLMAIGLVRYQFRGRGVANLLIILPMATPEIVIGAALLSMFVNYQVAPGFNTLLIAHIMFCISFVVVVVRSRLIGFDRRIEEAAADLGATPFQTFRYVTLPLVAPGVVAAALLAFALSIDDFVISNFNSGTTLTYPLYVFGVSLRGIPVQVNVLATIIFIVTVIGIAGVLYQQRRAERWPKSRRKTTPMWARPAGAGRRGPGARRSRRLMVTPAEFETRLLIGGEQVAGGGAPLLVENPATEETIAEAVPPPPVQVDAAIAAAREAAAPGLTLRPASAARCCTRSRRSFARGPTSLRR